MPGFPIIRVNPIPILQKIGSLIFTHDEVSVSNFVVTNSSEPLIASTGDNLKISAENNLTARTVGD